MTAQTRRLLIAFAALGLVASGWSSYVHYSLLTVPGYTSFCDVSGAVSCTQAYLSQFGSMWGVPVSLGGVVYFSVVLVLAAFAARRPGPARENVPAYVFALSTVALAFVMYLAWASIFKLHALCVLCATTYIAVVALFIISGGASTLPMTSLPRRATADLAALVRSPFALVLSAVLVGGTFALVNVFPRAAHAATTTAENTNSPQIELLTDQEKANFIRQYEALPRVTVPIDAGGAKVLVVKFNDYQCPPCRQSYIDYKWAIAKYQALGQLKFVLKHFPLERECNAHVPGDLHVASCEAAAAVVMAQSKGTADKLEEWFFANQPTLTPERVKEGAAMVGGITDFDAQYARALTLVKTDAGLGALLGAKSTPTFVVNGHVIAGALPPAYFELAIQHELKR